MITPSRLVRSVTLLPSCFYFYVVLIVSFLQVFTLKSCMHSFLLCILHTLRIISCSTPSFWQYMSRRRFLN
jgi:hypothetical protein